MKKPKQINVSEEAIEIIDRVAFETKPRTNFKNYVENLIEREAVRLAKKNKNK